VSLDLGAIIAAERPGKRRPKRRNPKTMAPVAPRRTDEVWLERRLAGLAAEVQRELEELISETLSEVDVTATQDALTLDRDPTKSTPKLAPRRRVRVSPPQAQALETALAEMQQRMTGLDRLATKIARQFVSRVDTAHRKRWYAQLKSATSVDLEKIVVGEGLGSAVARSIDDNVKLIKSIPQEHLGRVRDLIDRAVMQGEAPPGGMRAELQRIGGITRKRAQFIARDQTAKLNSELAQARAQAIGITEYIWRTSGDDRVRESHASKNGKRFRYDSPPPDTGHPGMDYQCRCTARPVMPD